MLAIRRYRTYLTAFIVFIAFTSPLAIAENSGLYVGSGVGLEDFKTQLDKHPDGNALPSLSLSDLVFSDGGGSSGTPYSLGAFAGYRVHMKDRGLWIAVQTELVLRGNATAGSLSGIGVNDEGELVTDVLAEDWSLRTESDRALIGKIGSVMTLLGLIDFSVYALAGIRELSVELSRTFEVCGVSHQCEPDEPTRSVSESHMPELTQWTIGLGIEKSIGDKTAIQIETRYTGTEKEEWIDEEGNMTTPLSISADRLDLSVNLAHYF